MSCADRRHRMYHVPQVTNEAVGHFVEGLNDLTDKAAHNSTDLPLDSDALQYFAAHVYAIEVAGGGDECIGEIGHHHADEAQSADQSQTQDDNKDSQSGGKDCHTHADGTVHCDGGHESTDGGAAAPQESQPQADAAPQPAPQVADSAAPADDCHTHADGTVHCGSHDAAPAAEPAAAETPAPDTAGKDCHTHADGTVHCS